MEDRNRPVTGYPVFANPRPNGHPNAATAAAAPPPNAYNSTWLRRILMFVIVLILFLGILDFVAWLINIHPQLPEFRVDSLSISDFTLSDDDSLVSFTSEIKLTARNPNKKVSLAHDDILTEIYYKSHSLADTTIAPFHQAAKTETSVTAKFDVDEVVGEEVNDSTSVEFNLKVVSRVRFEAKGYTTMEKLLKVFCGDLLVGLPPTDANGTRSGTLTGAPKQCSVALRGDP